MRILAAGPSDAIAMRRPLEWILRRGHEVCLVDITYPDFAHAYQASARKHLRFVPAWPGYSPETRPGRVRAWLRVLQLRAVAAVFRPDVVHAHHMLAPTGWCIQARLKPLVVSAWGGLNDLLEDRQVGLDPRMGALLRATDALIVESPALAAACRALPEHPRVALIPLGADTRHFSPGGGQRAAWRRGLAISDEAILLLSPRNWLAVYNHDLILEAFALARPRLRRPAALVFIKIHPEEVRREPHQSYARASRLVEELGLADMVRWLPRLRYEMMPALYAMADIVVNYPAQDAFPSTLVEAAACERPIISARLPGYRDTFVEAFCTLVEPGQPAALAEAIVEMVNTCSEDHAARLRLARQAVVEAYDERIFEEKLLQLYRDVAGKGIDSTGAG